MNLATGPQLNREPDKFSFPMRDEFWFTSVSDWASSRLFLRLQFLCVYENCCITVVVGWCQEFNEHRVRVFLVYSCRGKFLAYVAFQVLQLTPTFDGRTGVQRQKRRRSRFVALTTTAWSGEYIL